MDNKNDKEVLLVKREHTKRATLSVHKKSLKRIFHSGNNLRLQNIMLDRTTLGKKSQNAQYQSFASAMLYLGPINEANQRTTN